MLSFPTAVDVREVGPRDGLQIEAPVGIDDKVKLLRALVATGVRRIEATAFVSPRAVPAMADAEQVAAFVQTVPDIDWSALVASPNGARRAVAAGMRNVEYAAAPLRRERAGTSPPRSWSISWTTPASAAESTLRRCCRRPRWLKTCSVTRSRATCSVREGDLGLAEGTVLLRPTIAEYRLGMEQRVSLITLGVDDLARSKAFYLAMGWQGQEIEETVFFQAGGLAVVLWGREKLAEDAGIAPERFRGGAGIVLAQNVRSSEEVDQIIETAERSGGVITRAANKTFYGGYAGYFADPDGHQWEVAYNPGFALAADGSLELPVFGQP